MLVFLLFTTLTATVLTELELQSSGMQSSTAGRVVGGEEVPHHSSWPWQVSLQYYSDGSYHHFCGGTLIRRGWVMTAAHCMYSSSSLRVVLGDLILHNSDGTEQFRSVINVYIHPEWNNNSISSGNDIALLRLSSEASLTRYVKLASLPPLGEVLLHNSPCYIIGYGRTSDDWWSNAYKNEAGLPSCRRPRDLHQLRLVGQHRQDHHDLCRRRCTVRMQLLQGDFGGPLSCRIDNSWYVHGIASFVSGMGCNAPQKPTVFTRVSAYITWMNLARK